MLKSQYQGYNTVTCDILNMCLIMYLNWNHVFKMGVIMTSSRCHQANLAEDNVPQKHVKVSAQCYRANIKRVITSCKPLPPQVQPSLSSPALSFDTASQNLRLYLKGAPSSLPDPVWSGPFFYEVLRKCSECSCSHRSEGPAIRREKREGGRFLLELRPEGQRKRGKMNESLQLSKDMQSKPQHTTWSHIW